MFSLKDKLKPETIFLKTQVAPAESKIAEDKFRDINTGPVPGRPKEISPAQTDTSLSWDDIVFKNRNREYGAYVLRKSYLRNVFAGAGATLLILAIFIYAPALSEILGHEKVTQKPAPRKLVYTELSAPPPIDKPKPLPPQIQLPKLQKVIKFVPPKVVKEEVIGEAPTMEEIKQNDVAAVAIEGPTDVVFEEPVAEVLEEDDDEVFVVVEQNPEFVGGYEAMMAFIKNNMVYPAMARRMHTEGTVYVSFIVSKTGEIRDVQVMRGITRELDQEAVRVVQLMPPWKPGTQNGRKVSVRFTLPIRFRMN